MANLVSYEHRPSLKCPVVIEGLPGVGNVGKLAADIVAEQLGAERFAVINSDDLPPQAILDGNSVAGLAACELWHADLGDRDAVFILGDFQGTTPSGQYNLSEYTFRLLLPYDPSLIITLGGYGTGQLVQAPRVLGAVSDPSLKPMMEQAGIGFYPGEPQGGIVGAAAMFLGLGKAYDIDSMCIMGETSGYIVDHRSARNVAECMCRILGVDVDLSPYDDFVKTIDEASIAIEQDEKPSEPEDLVYIR